MSVQKPAVLSVSPSIFLEGNTRMGRVVLLGLLLLDLLLACRCMSSRTPNVSQIRGGGGPARTSGEDRVGSADVHLQRDAPPMFYGALSSRSVGRYVLATSSLVRECARVYTPAPLGNIASSLCSRFSIGLNSRGEDARGYTGKRKPSGFSYDKFMSPDKRTGDEEDDLGGDGDPTATPVAPEKYGRVSSAFLVRHEIGDDSTRITKAPPEKEKMKIGVELHSPVLGGNTSQKRSASRVDRRRASPRASAGSVLKSFGSLGRDKTRRSELDDMDLLSDSDDDGDGWDQGAGVDTLSGGKVVFEGSGEADSVRVTAKTTAGRNLVDVDDAATTLVDKLRLGKSSGAASHGRNRRKTRRERGSNRNRE